MTELDRITYETGTEDGCRLRHIVEFGHDWMLRDPVAWQTWVANQIMVWDAWGRRWHDHDDTFPHEASA